jgi:trans-2,3-dihydro-3-hydroxyanthranilate isomerase
MPTLPFFTYDVFTTKRRTGNPLAVIIGGEDLSTPEMQSIAREFNLSETIFLQAPENPAHTARARIFTPTVEMPFAGHPTIGGAIHAALARFTPEAEIDAVVVLEEPVGPVRCAVTLKPGSPAFAEFDAPRLSHSVKPAPSNAQIAQALGIEESAIGFAGHTPSVFSAGAAFVFVPLASLRALALCRPSPLVEDVADGAIGVLAYTPLPEDGPHAFRARMFAPGAGVTEDPATGSAAAAMAGVIAQFETLPDGAHLFAIEQGVEMGRPSRLALEVRIANAALSGCRIGGHAVLVSQGQMFL